jgi:hypothetical protein
MSVESLAKARLRPIETTAQEVTEPTITNDLASYNNNPRLTRWSSRTTSGTRPSAGVSK